jgi:hypothetical protein
MKCRIIISCILFMVLSSCTKSIVIPDVSGVDVDTVKSMLVKNDIIPKIEYKYHDIIEENLVIGTEPSIGTSVDKNEPIIVYVSKGKEVIESKNSLTTLYNISGIHNFKQDEFGFSNPRIMRDTLIIDFFIYFNSNKNFEWSDPYNSGDGYGTAIITNENSYEIPLKVQPLSNEIKEFEKHNFSIRFPITDLKSKPTTLSTFLVVEVNEVRYQLQIDFTISW